MSTRFYDAKPRIGMSSAISIDMDSGVIASWRAHSTAVGQVKRASSARVSRAT
jgi:hypothetical protein